MNQPFAFQIDSYEQAEESDIQELFLMHSSFMKDLIEYSGYKPKEEKNSKKTPTRRNGENRHPGAAVHQEEWRETRSGRKTIKTKRYGNHDEDYTPNYAELDDDADYVYSGSRNPTTKPPPSTMSKATTTPLVEHVFKCFFKNQGRYSVMS